MKLLAKAAAVVLLAAMSVLPGCATPGQGAVSGGLGGAAVGGVIGNQSGNAIEGAAIGGAVGAATGAIVGNENRKNREREGGYYDNDYDRHHHPRHDHY